MKKTLIKIITTASALFFSGGVFAQTAKVQVIHNCADAAAAEVDVYVNGNLTFNNFAFRTSTAFLDLPAGVPLSIAVAPGTSTNVSEALYTTSLTLTNGNRYVVVANGIVSPTGYSPAPAFGLNAYNLGTSTGVAPAGTTGLLVVHGSTDAPTVDVGLAEPGSYTNVINDLAYSTSSPASSYTDVPTADYQLQIRTADGLTGVAEYSAPLQTLGLGTQSIVVLASGFLTPGNNSNGPAFGLYVALPTGGALVPLSNVGLSPARVQIIHNAADAAAASVDVYLNNGPTPTLDNFAFRTATPFIDFPASTDVEIDIAGGNSTGPNPAVFTQTVNVPTGTYILVANGIVSPTGYSPAPAFGLDVFAGARESATDGNNTDVLVYHGSTDAPTVDVKEVSGPLSFPTIVDNASYNDFAGYLSLPTSDYSIQVRTSDGVDAVAEYGAPLQTLSLNGVALTVLASGFLNPANNSGGPAFGLYVALPSGGNLIPLPTQDISTSRVQIIHNAADPAAAQVDVVVNGTTVADNFAFRAATPFIDLKGGLPYNIEVKTANGATTIGSIPAATFTANEKYVVLAQGVAGPGFETNADVDADDNDFGFYVYEGAKEKPASNSTFEFIGVHGSTDAPKVDIIARGVATVLDNVSYGDISATYIPVPAASYLLDVTPAADNATIVATYGANLTGLNGKTGVVFASGFLTPANDNDGPAFSLCFALNDGTTGCFSNVTSIEESNLVVNTSLYPNPANVTTTFEYTLKEKTDFTLRIVDVTGKVIENIYKGNQAAGLYRETVDLSGYAAGVYFIQVNNGVSSFSKKLIITN
ncbi:MAG: DUF4397 domain-containing protein [Sphingobacteriales bacterium JAD_PAG50586_3]|nr:MAG: DUF4397 domain-containing protein [Sphingobacteriales bacterium JAD_PAG50586_3]